MRKTAGLLLAAVALLCVPAHAQDDKRFAIRFGPIYVAPVSDSSTSLGELEFDDGVGGEFDFEWYITKHFGLEASIAIAADIDVNDRTNTTTADGVTVTPLTVGLNWHIVRNGAVDWAIGAVGGAVVFGDFLFVDNSSGGTFISDSETEVAFGVQSFLDINIGESWAINLGVKYLEVEAEASDLAQVKIDVDPIIGRVMGVFRW